MKSFLPAVVLLSLLFTLSEVSGKNLECYKRYVGQDSDSKDTCSGNDVVCVTFLDIDSQKVTGKDCDERENVESWCRDEAKKYNNKCNDPCDTDLCNDEQ